MDIYETVINELMLIFECCCIDDNPNLADTFFELFGQKIQTADIFYKLILYEKFLKKLKEINPAKYEKIHKGNPYYFLAIYSYILHKFEKATFYMDAALCEDQNNFPDNWREKPAALFMLLDEKNPHQAALDITKKLKKELENQFKEYNNWAHEIKEPEICFDSFINKFVIELLDPAENKKNSYRSIITSFYSFILEYKDLKEMIKLSPSKGSIGPFISYLFKGGVIFESILKFFYKDCSKDTIYKIKNKIEKEFDVKLDLKTSADSFKEIFKYLNNYTLEKILSAVAMIRNCTAHNLARDFINEEEFDILFETIIKAMLLFLAKKTKEVSHDSR